MIVNHVVVPNTDDNAKETNQHSLDSSYIGNQIKQSVPRSLNHFLIEIHLKGYFELDV